MLHEIIKDRYSPRSFSKEKIDIKALLSLFEAARWSPSSMNEQPWRFIISTRDDTDNFNKMMSVLNDTNKVWAVNAPLLILTITKLRNSKNNQLNKYAFYDAGQAVAYLTMQAAHMGLFVRQMGGFNSELAQEIFNIPDDYIPVTLIAAGHKGDVNDLPPSLRERENAVRNRKPLQEILFTGEFNSPVNIEEKELINIQGLT